MIKTDPSSSEVQSPVASAFFLLILSYASNTMSLVNGLRFNNLRGDVYGGLTAAVVALPLAMAMGVASGVGPIAGMYGAITRFDSVYS